jgi:hypothetical protein
VQLDHNRSFGFKVYISGDKILLSRAAFLGKLDDLGNVDLHKLAQLITSVTRKP